MTHTESFTLTQESIKNLSIDEINNAIDKMEKTLEHKPFDVLTIHDDFKCHFNNAYVMKQTQREILADINDVPLFESFIQQITGSEVTPIVGDLTRQDILNSKYAIC